MCIVTVGGSGVGEHLLRRVMDAYPRAKKRIPRPANDRRRRTSRSILHRYPLHEGLEVRAFVHELYRHLAACDIAVVQGGF